MLREKLVNMVLGLDVDSACSAGEALAVLFSSKVGLELGSGSDSGGSRDVFLIESNQFSSQGEEQVAPSSHNGDVGLLCLSISRFHHC